MSTLKGKVAFITGATSGIGAEIMRRFADEGALVAGCGRNIEAGQAIVAEIENSGGKAAFFQADVSKSEQLYTAIQSTVEKFGPLNCAVNNAGTEGSFGPLHELEETVWDEVMATNMKGIWLSLKHEIPQLIKSGGGTIVNVSTNLTRIGMPSTAIYTSSKAGVDSLTKIAAIENASNGLRVNAVNPGAVLTPMTHRLWTAEDVVNMENSNPLGKIGSTSDVANACIFLSSSLSGHINGELINIDGGQTLL